MTPEETLRLKLARLQGEYIGTLMGICAWGIPEALKERLEILIKVLEHDRKGETKKPD